MTTLADRYVHAATRRLPEDQRHDVADELRGNIADRVESFHEERPGIDAAGAEHAVLVELGDPDRLAAGYTGQPLQLIGPETYPAYVRVLKALLVTAVPAATIVVATIDAIEGDSIGAVLGGAVWMAFIVATQVAFWVTFAFALVERGSGSDDVRRSLAVDWTPDQLPDLPNSSSGSVGELVTNVAWLGFVGAAIAWQQFRSPVQDRDDRLPMLDPDLWSFWLPLILVLLVLEMGFEMVKYRAGSWSPALATVNVALAALFAAPVVYLAASDKLLNPAAAAEIQEGAPGFDPGTASTIIVVVSLAICVWDSVDGWRKARSA